MSDATYAENIRAGQLGSAKDVSDPVTEMEREFLMVLKITKTAADAMAADATTETYGCDVPFAGIVRAMYWKGDADIATDATDFITFTVNKRNAAGASSATVGTLTTSAVATAEFVRRSFTLTNANVEVAEGGSLNFAIAKDGAGQVVPKGDIIIHVLRQ